MEKDKYIKKEEAEIVRLQKEKIQRAQIEGLLRLYQDAIAIEKIDVNYQHLNIKNEVVRCLSNMINIVKDEYWYNIHPHDAFPNIDIRMLICECPAIIECPFMLAILRKIGMSRADYLNYQKRAGNMIAMEHKRKMGKRK